MLTYPDAPVLTRDDRPAYQEVITTVGTALGRTAQAQAVLEDIDATVAAEAAAHPELAGLTVAAVWDAAGTFYVYRPADARVAFLLDLDLGLESAPAVEELANGRRASTTR